MPKRKGYMTIAEHHARLKAEGKWDAYVARKKEQDEVFRRKEQEYARAEEPLVQELRTAGLAVDSVWDFVNGKVEAGVHAQVLPILLKHIERPYPDAIRDGMARAMAVPEAKFAWPMLVKLYGQEQGRRTKDGLAVAISNVADDETLDEVIALVRDTRYGESRVLLLSALERSHLPQARKALLELSGDPMLQKEIQIILRRLKSRRGR